MSRQFLFPLQQFFKGPDLNIKKRESISHDGEASQMRIKTKFKIMQKYAFSNEPLANSQIAIRKQKQTSQD